MRIFIVSLMIVLFGLAASAASADLSKDMKTANDSFSDRPDTFTHDFSVVSRSQPHFTGVQVHPLVMPQMRAQTSPMMKPWPKRSFSIPGFQH